MRTRLLLPATLALAVAQPAMAIERSVTVSGSCVKQVSSDRGAITITAEYTDNELKTAARKTTEAYDKVRDEIKRLKLADAELRTSEYNVFEVREWEKGKMVSKGFRARMGLRVSSSDIQRLGEVISIAAKEDIKDVGALESYLSEEKIRSEQFSCLQQAAENARAKAERLASTLSSRVGEVISITESNQVTAPPPRIAPRAMMMAEAGAPAAPAVVEGGRQEIAVTVQAAFRLQ